MCKQCILHTEVLSWHRFPLEKSSQFFIFLTCRWIKTTIACQPFFIIIINSQGIAVAGEPCRSIFLNHLFFFYPWGRYHCLYRGNKVNLTSPLWVAAWSWGAVRKLMNVFVISLMAHYITIAPELGIYGNHDRCFRIFLSLWWNTLKEHWIKSTRVFSKPNLWKRCRWAT